MKAEEEKKDKGSQKSKRTHIVNYSDLEIAGPNANWGWISKDRRDENFSRGSWSLRWKYGNAMENFIGDVGCAFLKNNQFYKKFSFCKANWSNQWITEKLIACFSFSGCASLFSFQNSIPLTGMSAMVWRIGNQRCLSANKPPCRAYPLADKNREIAWIGRPVVVLSDDRYTTNSGTGLNLKSLRLLLIQENPIDR